MQELLQEFLRFPHGKHDDIVDAVVLGIRQMQELIQRIQFQAKATQMVSRWVAARGCRGKNGHTIR